MERNRKIRLNINSIIIFFVCGVPVVAQWLTNLTKNHEVVGLIPGLTQGVRIQHCRELWYRSQTWLGARIAVALV